MKDFDTIVGERDAGDVAREVEHGMLATADLLDVDGPAAFQTLGSISSPEAGSFEVIAELRAEDRQQRVAASEVAIARILAVASSQWLRIERVCHGT